MGQDLARKAPGAKKAEGGTEEVSELAARFQIPEAYFESYLQSGRAEGEPPDWRKIVAERAAEALSKEQGEGFDKAFSAWLFEQHLQTFLVEHQRPASDEQRAPLVEELARLAPFDRGLLRAFVVERGHDAAVVRALGAEGMQQLDPTPPPPRPPLPKDDKKKDKEEPEEKAQGPKPDEAEEKPPDGNEEKGESRGQFQGDSLFDKLFGAVLRDKKLAAGPGPLLQQLDALDDLAWAELARITDEKNGWDPLALLVGPPLEALVAKKRIAPFERLIAAHDDGLCPPDEQRRHHDLLESLGPFEKRHVLTALVARGIAKKLVPLLGERFITWAGGEFVEPPPPPVEDPAAALAALRPLPMPTQRRILVALQKGAAGPALADALGIELDRFTESYHDAVAVPEARGKRLPKPALEALRRVAPEELTRLLPPAEVEPDSSEGDSKPAADPSELPIGGTDAKLSALLRPLVRGTILSAAQRDQALEMFGVMSQAELAPLLARLTSDELAQLEVGLGPRFRRGLENTFYQPLKNALDAHAPGVEPPASLRTTLTTSLGEMTVWTRELLRDRIKAENMVERVAALVGPELDEGKKRELGIAEPPAVPPSPRPEAFFTPPERKAAAKVLARLSPGDFPPLAAELRPDVLRRFAAGASDDELGGALLKLLPPDDGKAPPPLAPEIELVQIGQFFERLAASKEGADDLGAVKRGAPPRRKKRGEEDEPMHDGLELDTLCDELFAKEQKPDDDLGPDTARPRAEKFASLPEDIRRALADRLREEGRFDEVAAALGDAFVSAVPEK